MKCALQKLSGLCSVTPFEQAFEIVIGNEGGYSNDSADPGNWTGGRVGLGKLNGTNFGISAASYPTLDIVSLSVAEAQDLYRHEYWDIIHGDQMDIKMSIVLFDAAVNCGVERAVKWLQQAVGTTTDGLMGPSTLAAIQQSIERSNGIALVCAEVQALRLVFMSKLPTWRAFGLGWARRVCRLPYQSPATGT